MSGGFLALLDDVATIMSKAAANTKIVAASIDDIAAMTGAGAKGASAVVIDDIPVNAQAVTEFEIDPKKEIPIVRAIEKGSLFNKAIAVPLAILINSFAPALLAPILAVGGAYLGYEGAEKVLHAIGARFFGHHEEEAASPKAKTQEEFEKQLIRGAVRTDLVMSVEIIFIALASIKDFMPDAHWTWLFLALATIGYVVTKGIYGLVKGLIRLDDLALHLDLTAGDNRAGKWKKKVAAFIIRFSPLLMKTLSVVGCAAMLFISGELLSIQFPQISDLIHHLPDNLGKLTHFLAFSLVGLTVGAIMIFTITLAKTLIQKKS